MTMPAARLEELLDVALRPYEQRPPAKEVTSLIAGLTLCGDHLRVAAGLIPSEDRGPRAESAIEEWEYVTARGPQGDDATDAWNHARALARSVQVLTAVLVEHDLPGVVMEVICCRCDRTISDTAFETISVESASAALPDQHAHLWDDPECSPVRARAL